MPVTLPEVVRAIAERRVARRRPAPPTTLEGLIAALQGLSQSEEARLLSALDSGQVGVVATMLVRAVREHAILTEMNAVNASIDLEGRGDVLLLLRDFVEVEGL